MYSNRNANRHISRENGGESRGDMEREIAGDIAGQVLPARGSTVALRDCGLSVGCPHWGVDTGSPARLWPTDNPCWNRGVVRNKEPWGKRGRSRNWQKETITLKS